MRFRRPEDHYLDLLAQVLEHGNERIDRTGVGTRSIFGAMLRFDLRDGNFPVLTTKRVAWKSAIKEMLWFLSGETNIRPLLQEGVRIWTDWPLAAFRKQTGIEITQEAFEDRILANENFADRWGNLGPVYGKQWRRWNADGKEYDQISDLIKTLRTNPTSRRMLFHAWNVAETDQMALPPCHLLYQYHVEDGYLNCMMYQRSADLFLGVPFNLVGTAALQYMLAQQTGLKPGQMIWVGGDVHLYTNHLEQAAIQIERKPTDFPMMDIKGIPSSIDDYKIEDFDLMFYEPQAAIKADVAV